MSDKKNQEEQPNIDTLTPWQKENLKYLDQEGKKPQWLEKPDEEEVEHLSFDENMILEETEPEKSDFLMIDATKKESSEDRPGDEKKEKTTVELDKEGKPKELPKSQSYADRLPKISHERQQRLRRRLLIIIGFCLVAIIALTYYISPYSKLNAIEVVGNEKIKNEQIADATGYKKNEFFWTAYFNGDTLDEIKKISPRIKTVSKSISHVNNIKFNIEEHQEVAYAKLKGNYYAIIDNGVITEEPVEKTNKEFVVFTNFENDDNLAKLFKMYQTLDDAMKKNIAEIVLNPDGKISSRLLFRLKDGNQIIGSVKDITEKIGYYEKVAKEMKEPGVVDMEAGIFSYSYETKEAQEKKDLLNKTESSEK